MKHIIKKHRLAKPEEYKYLLIEHRVTKKKDENIILRKRLNDFIDTHNISAHQLGKMCSFYGSIQGINFGRTTIYAYLRGDCSPKIDRLIVLSEVMGVPVEYLTGYSDDIGDKVRFTMKQ